MMPTERDIFERRVRLLEEQDREHRPLRDRWLAEMRAILTLGDSSVRSYLARNDRLEPECAVVLSGEGLDGVADAMVQVEVVAPELHDDGQDCDLVNTRPRFEQGHSFFDHFTSPVGVGTSQGRARAEAMKDASASPRPDAPPPSTTTWSNPMRKLLDVCRRLEDHWAGDIIGVIFLFALIPSVLFLGPLLFGGK